MTIEQAQQWVHDHPECHGFTYNTVNKNPEGAVHIWFKKELNVLYNETWWTWSYGRGME